MLEKETTRGRKEGTTKQIYLSQNMRIHRPNGTVIKHDAVQDGCIRECFSLEASLIIPGTHMSTIWNWLRLGLNHNTKTLL